MRSQVYGRRTGRCQRCGWTKPLRARRLCPPCYEMARYHGVHVDYERVHRPATDLIEDYEHLRGAGETDKQIAVRLGYATAKSMRASLRGARQRLGQP